MRARRALPLLALALCLLAPAGASASRSVGTPSQIAWVRSAATRFIDAELSGNGAAACGVLNAPLRVTRDHRTCEQRQDSRIAAMLRESTMRRHLEALRRAVTTAAVIVHGNVASLDLKSPLLNGPNHFVWTEMCWMLES
jgi:hypothetical protein